MTDSKDSTTTPGREPGKHDWRWWFNRTTLAVYALVVVTPLAICATVILGVTVFLLWLVIQPIKGFLPEKKEAAEAMSKLDEQERDE